MNLVLNENSNIEVSLMDFLDYSQEFYGVELKFSKIKNFLSENEKLKKLEEILDIKKLKPISIYSLNNFNLCSNETYSNEIIPKLKEMLKICYKIGCYMIILHPSSEIRNTPRWKIIRRTIKKLKHISKLAYREDIKIGLEFTAYPDSSIQTLSQAKEVMNPLKSQDNLGYIIDTFYLTKSFESWKNLKEIRDYIHLIQLSDIKFNPRTFQDNTDNIKEENRLIPGEGKFDFKKFLKYSKKLHYTEPFSIEIFPKNQIENLYSKVLEGLTISKSRIRSF